MLPRASAADPAPGKSLDEELLDDLNKDLLPPAKPPGAKPEKTSPPARPKTAPAGLPDESVKPLIDGEDVDLSGKSDDPLERIGGRMRQVEGLIVKHDTSSRTQTIQKQILRELDQLLEQTQQQCQNCKNGAPSGQNKPKPKSGQSSQGNEGLPPATPPRDSTERLGKAGSTEVKQAEEMEQLVRQSWGNLPEKLRNQLQNVTVEQFLPKYEKLIEAYYQRLAEE